MTKMIWNDFGTKWPVTSDLSFDFSDLFLQFNQARSEKNGSIF